MGCSFELGVRRHLSPQAAFARGVSCSSERRRPLRLRLAPGSDVRLRSAGEMGTGDLLRTLRVGRDWTLAPGPQFPHLGDKAVRCGRPQSRSPEGFAAATTGVVQAPGSPCLGRVLHEGCGLGCGLHPSGRGESTQIRGSVSSAHLVVTPGLAILLPLVLYYYGSQNSFFQFEQGPCFLFSTGGGGVFCFCVVSGGILLSVLSRPGPCSTPTPSSPGGLREQTVPLSCSPKPWVVQQA